MTLTQIAKEVIMRHYTELARFERDGFDIILDKTWEDDPVAFCFDDTCWDIKDIERKIDSGVYDWFMLRVRVLVEGLELGSAYLGGCLYEDAREVLTDGTADDIIDEALRGAKLAVWPLMRRLQSINADLEAVNG
jgi:hypothetical protein